MSIEPKSTTGPHSSAGSLSADWLVQSGVLGMSRDAILLKLPQSYAHLPLASAAALKDALVVHLRNMGWDDPDTKPSGGVVIDYTIPPSVAVKWDSPHLDEAAAVDALHGVPVEVRDAYAENARTIGAVDVHLMTDEEASTVHAQLAESTVPGMLKDDHGILYTASAVRDLKVKAGRHLAKLAAAADAPVVPADAWDRTFTPVETGTVNITRAIVREWTDAQCEGAWNHATENPSGPYPLTDRPSGRNYSVLAARMLRQRLNRANGADAQR